MAAGLAEAPRKEQHGQRHRGAERERERDLLARWRAGEFTGRWLPTTDGAALCVHFAGRPGGPAGPDFRDAVLLRRDGSPIRGDVELHLRARGWQQHGHDRDSRYNHVVLHVVRRADGARETTLASGAIIPLTEIAAAPEEYVGGALEATRPVWPCAGHAAMSAGAGVAPDEHGANELSAVLAAAGQARFEAHVAGFAAALMRDERSDAPRIARWAPFDVALCVALAEGLAFGRERALMRQAGAWLASGGAPDALTRELPRLPRLDAARLEGLLALFARWQAAGPWAPLRAALAWQPDQAALAALARELRVAGGLVSRGRAAILMVNVVLPAAAAWAARQGDAEVLARAGALYAASGGLPSNQITREMARQLALPRQPKGARAQQGLQHIWANWCRDKRCATCPCAHRGLQGISGVVWQEGHAVELNSTAHPDA